MSATPPRAVPALFRVVAPAAVDASALVVALSSALRARGFRVGTAESRGGLGGAAVTTVVTGSGARITLPGAVALDTLAQRAAALDPGLDVLLVVGERTSAGVPPRDVEGADVVEVEEVEEVAAATDDGSAATTDASRPALVASVPASRLAAAPMSDFGLAALIEERVRPRSRAAALARAVETPIESERRLLERASPPSGARAPRRPTTRGWRRWLGL